MAIVLLSLSKCMYCKNCSVLHGRSENVNTGGIKYNENDNWKNTYICNSSYHRTKILRVNTITCVQPSRSVRRSLADTFMKIRC